MKITLLITLTLITVLVLFGCTGISSGTVLPTASANTEPTIIPSETVFIEVTESCEPVESDSALVSSKAPSRSDFVFTTSENGEKITDAADITIPAYVDIVSVSKTIDESDIFVYIELRGIPDMLTVNCAGLDNPMLLEYCWYISFDTNEDGRIDGNVTLNHEKFWKDSAETPAAVDSADFRTVALQHQTRTDYTVASADFSLDGNVMVFHLAKNEMVELTAITENTPFYVFSENVTSDYYFCDMVPGS
jgi:hypothetical protein